MIAKMDKFKLFCSIIIGLSFPSNLVAREGPWVLYANESYDSPTRDSPTSEGPASTLIPTDSPASTGTSVSMETSASTGIPGSSKTSASMNTTVFTDSPVSKPTSLAVTSSPVYMNASEPAGTSMSSFTTVLLSTTPAPTSPETTECSGTAPKTTEDDSCTDYTCGEETGATSGEPAATPPTTTDSDGDTEVDIGHIKSNDSSNALDEVGLTTAEFVRLRGYYARDHRVVTLDGYILNLVRCTNPLINSGLYGHRNKSVVLFVHGLFTDANGFMLRSDGVEPRDFSRYNASTMTRAQLAKMLVGDPSINSLPFLLMNFGHEVWMVNRRGSRQSLTRVDGDNAVVDRVLNINATIAAMVNRTVDAASMLGANLSYISKMLVDSSIEQARLSNATTKSKFWNFSMDEQAKYDIPELIRYIRNATGRKFVSIVAHSAGGAITLMSLIRRPKLAARLGRIVLWSPTINVGLHNYIERQQFINKYSSGISDYTGSAPPLFVYQPLQTAFANRCMDERSQKTACLRIFAAIFGREGRHQRVLPGYIYNLFTPSSAREVEQVRQSVRFGGLQHYFDFGTAEANKRAYGSAQPPPYIFSRIASKKISILVGKTDAFVSPKDLKATQNFLAVPVTYQVLAGPGKAFNHVSYLINDNAGAIVCLSSLRKLELDV